MIEAVMVSGRPDAAKRRCFDCLHCRAAVSWWCTNKTAIDHHGTAVPGRSGCDFWEPVRVDYSFRSAGERIVTIHGDALPEVAHGTT